MDTELSEYETNRARNVERNNARLRALFLISVREEVEKERSSRKSRRLQGLTAEGVPSLPQCKEERQKRVVECREARRAAALWVYEQQHKDTKKAARENPTATYEHCLMRVQTMKDKALANRVMAIERATGKHLMVKMAVFKSCLQDEGQWELAELACAALERMKALQPPPPPDA